MNRFGPNGPSLPAPATARARAGEEACRWCAAGQVLLRPGRLAQRVGAADPHVELALGDPVEHLARAPPQFGSVGDVVHQGGPGEEQRSAAVQPLRVDRRDLTTRGSVQHHHAARAQRRQAVVEGVLAYAVVNDVRPGTVTGLVDDVAEAVVADDVIGAGLQRELDLLPARGGTDNKATTPLDHLGQQQPDPAGRRVHHGDVAFAHRVGAGAQVVGGHALQDGGCRDLQVHPVGYRHDAVRGQRDLFGVATPLAGPGHTIAHGQVLDVGPDGDDRPRAFRAEHEGRIGPVVAHALALVDVHVVHAGRGDLHDHLARPRPRRLPLGHGQHLGPTHTLADYHAHDRTLLRVLFPDQPFTGPGRPGQHGPA